MDLEQINAVVKNWRVQHEIAGDAQLNEVQTSAYLPLTRQGPG
jgi:hypothetical protein